MSYVDYRLQTSAQQGRVVYGTGADARYRPATALFAAKDTRLSSDGLAAAADMTVTVSNDMLSLTDDQARPKALAIALAAAS